MDNMDQLISRTFTVKLQSPFLAVFHMSRIPKPQTKLQWNTLTATEDPLTEQPHEESSASFKNMDL